LVSTLSAALAESRKGESTSNHCEFGYLASMKPALIADYRPQPVTPDEFIPLHLATG